MVTNVIVRPWRAIAPRAAETVISALFYLQFCSMKNRLLMRFRRLKQPKYLVGAIVGAVWFYFYFGQVLFGFGRRGPWNASDTMKAPSLPTDPLFYESIGALIFLTVILFGWIFPNQRAAPVAVPDGNLQHHQSSELQLARIWRERRRRDWRISRL